MSAPRHFAVLSAFALLLAACSGSGAASAPLESASSVPTASAPAASAPAASAPADDLTVRFSIYSFASPYGKGVERGALDAGDDLSVEVVTAGTPGFDLAALSQIISDQMSAGTDGLVAPGHEGLATVQQEAVASGVPLSTFDLCNPALKSLCIAQASVQSGRELGAELVKLAGGAAATGKALIGNCIPGLAVLEERIKGVTEGLAAAPGIEVVTFATAAGPTENYPLWEQGLATNPDTTMVIGSCSTDTMSVGRLNAANDNRMIAAGYDITPETIQPVADGSTAIAVGQGTYLQGYLGVRAIVDSLRAGTPLPVGWIDSGTEFVTAENVETYLGFFEGTGMTEHDFYADQLDADLESQIRPVEDYNK